MRKRIVAAMVVVARSAVARNRATFRAGIAGAGIAGSEQRVDVAAMTKPVEFRNSASVTGARRVRAADLLVR